MRKVQVLLFVAVLALAQATVHFEEHFDDDEQWQERWVQSEHPDKGYGAFKRSAGKYSHDELAGYGIKTSDDARFYGLSSKFESFSNQDKNLVIQFSVKHEQNLDCGGGYVKIFDSKLDQRDLHGESAYEIMFGPDICGSATKKVHVIFSYKGKNLELKDKRISCKDDTFTHFYTLIVTPENKYKVLIDNEEVESGTLEDDFEFLPPKTINDPSASKPSDWDDRQKIADPEDKKPADWDQPKTIVDEKAVKPDDWDDEMDGEWEAPQIDNPDHKGEWTPRLIDNPNYKGEWKHPQIANPEYVADDQLYLRKDIAHIGLDLWQVKSGSLFDNFLITDDVDVASQQASNIKQIIAAEEKLAKEEQEKASADVKPADDDSEAAAYNEDDEDAEEKPDEEEHDEL